VQRLVSTLETADAATTIGPERIIRSGSGPAVAASPRGRILSLDCTLSAPIRVAADGTGAYRVLSGAEHVQCPDGRFREGGTLRWPPDHPVRAEPTRG
jgi:hypothetical protein